MFILLSGGLVYAPEPIGVRDLLLGAGRILAMGEHLSPPAGYSCRLLDARGLLVLPGLVDAHVHLAGGGGEGGPATRTPEVALADLLRGGVTTAIGLLGADSVTRSVEGLLARARGLQAEGISTRIYTGAYQLPARILTNSLRADLVLVPEVLGVGEIAINDHRSSELSTHELARLAAEACLGGMLGGKPGLVHLHVGEGKRGLALLREALALSDLPAAQFYPTHLNRQHGLLQEAAELGKRGMPLDLTAGFNPAQDGPQALRSTRALAWLRAAGVPPQLITISSDGQGSEAHFDASGRLQSTGISPPDAVWRDVARAVEEEDMPLEEVLPACTANPAGILGLTGKGRLRAGGDADLLLVTPRLDLLAVLAGGRVLWWKGAPAGNRMMEEDFAS